MTFLQESCSPHRKKEIRYEQDRNHKYRDLVLRFFTVAIVTDGLEHAGRKDPVGHVSAYGAVHGVVIPPFNG